MRWSDVCLAAFAQLALTRHTVVVIAAPAVVAADGSCPANSKNCRTDDTDPVLQTARAPVSSGKEVAPVEPPSNLINQEIKQLQGYIATCKERIELLGSLQKTVTSGHDVSLPETHIKALQAKVPAISEITIDEDKLPCSSADDYIISKRVIPQVEPVAHVQFLPLRNPRTSSSSSTTQTSLPSALLVAVQENGETSMYSPTGELVQAFSVGHELPVNHLAVSPTHDEYFIATSDVGGFIRVHTIKLRQQRLTKDQKQSRRSTVDEKMSQYLGPQVNVTTTFQKQMQMPSAGGGEPPRVTALIAASQRGGKYFIAGDEEGSINVFSRNGTFLAKIDATVTPGGIEGLHSHTSGVIYRAGEEWGFINLEKMEVNRVDCPNFEGRVAAVIIDSQQATRVFVTSGDGSVWVLNLKNKKECKVDHVFPKGVMQNVLDLASVRGYVIGFEGEGNQGEPMSIVALNMSTVGRAATPRNPFPPSAVVWRKAIGSVRQWSVYKRHQQGDLIATLTQDGRAIEIMELLMSTYTPPSTDSFGNFKLPVIAVAIVLVLGYQYMKQKNKFGGSSSSKVKDFDGMDFSSLMKNKKLGAGLGKKGLGGLGGAKGLGGLGGAKGLGSKGLGSSKIA